MKIHDNEQIQKRIDQLEEYSIELQDELVYLQMIKEIEEVANQLQDQVLHVVVSYHKATLPLEHEDYSLCTKYTMEAMHLAKSLHMEFMVMRCYNTLAIIDSKQADYCSSLSHYIQAFQLAERHKEWKYSYAILNNIGNLFVWLNEHEIAIDYLIKSYEKYQEEEVDIPSHRDNIVLNIIEEYSMLRSYEEAMQWSNQEYKNVETKSLIQLILKVNEIDECYQKGTVSTINKLVSEVVAYPCDSNNFIYVYRACLRLFQITIEAKDLVHAKSLMQRLEEIKEVKSMETFHYDHIFLLYQYYEAFEEEEAPDSSAKRILKDYVKESQRALAQLRNTYTRRLLVETEMLKIQTEKEAAQQDNLKLQKDIELDFFTRILNKVSFETYYEKRSKHCEKDTYQALLLLDIDHFKDINDTYGHDRGDQILLQVVDLISASCTSNMLLGRFGGDEFILFVDDVKQVSYIKAIASELVEKAHTIIVEDQKHITFSVGGYLLNQKVPFKDAFLCVDQALYRAKRNGRNRFEIEIMEKSL